MIPKFEKGGNLPKGVHKATLDEVREIFESSPKSSVNSLQDKGIIFKDDFQKSLTQG